MHAMFTGAVTVAWCIDITYNPEQLREVVERRFLNTQYNSHGNELEFSSPTFSLKAFSLSRRSAVRCGPP